MTSSLAKLIDSNHSPEALSTGFPPISVLRLPKRVSVIIISSPVRHARPEHSRAWNAMRLEIPNSRPPLQRIGISGASARASFVSSLPSLSPGPSVFLMTVDGKSL